MDSSDSMSESNAQEKKVHSTQEHLGVYKSASVVQSANETAHNARLSDQSLRRSIPLSFPTPASVAGNSSGHTAAGLPQSSTSNAKTFNDKFVTKQKEKKVPSQSKSVWKLDTDASKQAYPTNFKYKKKRKKQRQYPPTNNPYNKSAYVFEISSDSAIQ